MRHGACGICDDGGVAGYGQRQCADGSRLIDGEQERAVGFQLIDEGAQLGLIVRQGLVVEATAVAIESDGMVVAFADVDADEDIDGA
ncbi:hypothetical protein PSP20601_05551 [Pandoraea sputorum]|nr:hypothetical protein PSP20601_05551 [Pandoraea sputorum]